MLKLKNSLICLSGNDTDTLWWFANRQRDAIANSSIYEHKSTTIRALFWIMDDMDKNGIDTCILIIPEPYMLEIKLVEYFKRDRMIDWHIFLKSGNTYKGEYPEYCHIWKDGKLQHG